MAKSKSLIALIKEIVRVEVQKEVNNIFIKEGVRAVTQNKGIVPEVLAKPIPKKLKPKEVSYTKDSTLNKILNETAQSQEFDEYPTMGGAAFDSTKMAEAMGYGNTMMAGNDEDKRKMGAAQTAASAGVNPSEVPEDVMNALTKDYRGLMKAIDEKDKTK